MIRLKELRSDKKLTQEQVAKHLNISTRAYSHYELGDRDPSIELLKQFCIYFDVTADYLIGLSDNY